MKKNIKTIIWVGIGLIIGISTTVGATAIFRSEDITYSSDKTDKTNVKDSLDELYSKVGKCPEGQYCFGKAMPISILELGDYISMTPTSTSYTPPSELTGCMNDENCMQNTINPSELNLWRVIRKNEDGTVDVVSEYVSSERVSFYGKTGYQNFVGGLNTIASQYTNEKYVQSTRHIGYSNQTEKLTNTTALLSMTAPWPKNTSVNSQLTECDASEYLCGSEEKNGGGDIGYQTDYNLVNEVLGTVVGKIPSGTSRDYWLASRIYYYQHDTFYLFHGRSVSPNDGLSSQNIYHRPSSGFSNNCRMASVRPILTLKAELKIVDGDGKSVETAYTFE